MAQVKFYRGKKEDYVLDEHIDGVYFATDTEEVVMNGKEYGKDPDWNEIEVMLSSPLKTRWYNGDTLIKEEDVVGELTSSYKETSATRVEIGTNVTSIDIGAFSSCTDLISIVIPNSVTSIGNAAFYGCTGLTSVTIPNSVTRISSGTFYGCTGLTSVTIPNSVTSIDSGAFQNCISLTSITIPNLVTSIDGMVFSGCTGLTSIYCNSVNEPCSVVGSTFPLNNPDIIGTLYVKKGGSASTYPTWMNDQGNLGNSNSGTWTVVEYFD